VPVWDVPVGTEAADLAGPVAEIAEALQAELASGRPLTGEERGTRAGLASRQLTLR
jgi:hypothetical protein